MMRVAGVIKPLTEEPLSAEDTRRLVIDALKEGQRAKLENEWQIDFALQVQTPLLHVRLAPVGLLHG